MANNHSRTHNKVEEWIIALGGFLFQYDARGVAFKEKMYWWYRGAFEYVLEDKNYSILTRILWFFKRYDAEMKPVKQITLIQICRNAEVIHNSAYDALAYVKENGMLSFRMLYHINRTLESLEESSLGNSLSGFDPTVCSLIASTEAAPKSDLIKTFDDAIHFLEIKRKIRADFIKLAVYPSVLIFLSFALKFFYNFWFVDHIATIMPKADANMAAAIARYKFSKAHTITYLLQETAVLWIPLILFNIREARLFMSMLVLKTPFLKGAIIASNMRIFFLIIGGCIKNNAPLNDALDAAIDGVASPLLAKELETQVQVARDGGKFKDVIAGIWYIDSEVQFMFEQETETKLEHPCMSASNLYGDIFGDRMMTLQTVAPLAGFVVVILQMIPALLILQSLMNYKG